MPTTTSYAPRLTTDTWALRIMAEAKAYRDEIGEAIPELDAYLADCLTVAAEVGTTTERPAADAPTAPRPASPTGASSYGAGRNAATPAQLSYLAKLADRLGYELQTPRDKAHASLIIDGAKKALAAKPATERPARTATPGQVAYLVDLLSTRAHDLGEVDPEALTFDKASELIGTLLATPRATAAKPAHGIAEGRYAYTPAEGAAQFYRVGRTGRITVQAGPSEHPYNGKLNEALLWIADHQRDAAALYGRLIGACGRCGRELTDETSRALGLGPVCAGKF